MRICLNLANRGQIDYIGHEKPAAKDDSSMRQTIRSAARSCKFVISHLP